MPDYFVSIEVLYNKLYVVTKEREREREWSEYIDCVKYLGTYILLHNERM